MKHFSLIALLTIGSLFAMELDQQALQEFLSNKKQMVILSQGKVDVNNLLFQEFVNLSLLNEESAARVYSSPSIQQKACSLFSWLSHHPTYITALTAARAEKTQEAWDAFRKGNAPLIQQYFDENGIKTTTTSCADFFNCNAHLNSEQVEKVVAQSFVVYYIRQLQRHETTVVPSAIQIK